VKKYISAINKNTYTSYTKMLIQIIATIYLSISLLIFYSLTYIDGQRCSLRLKKNIRRDENENSESTQNNDYLFAGIEDACKSDIPKKIIKSLLFPFCIPTEIIPYICYKQSHS
jgi:cell division protein FtsL